MGDGVDHVASRELGCGLVVRVGIEHRRVRTAVAIIPKTREVYVRQRAEELELVARDIQNRSFEVEARLHVTSADKLPKLVDLRLRVLVTRKRKLLQLRTQVMDNGNPGDNDRGTEGAGLQARHRLRDIRTRLGVATSQDERIKVRQAGDEHAHVPSGTRVRERETMVSDFEARVSAT
jgi:hypothetical protein